MSKEPKLPFRCPVCLELPVGKIFQCRNGHSVGGECSKELQQCPQCRIQYGGEEDRIRNLALEELIGEMDVPCSHQKAGCTVEIARKGLSAHLSVCPFRPIGICKGLNNKCDFVSSSGSELFQHLVRQHNYRSSRLKSDETIAYRRNISRSLEVMRANTGQTKKLRCLGMELTSTCKILEVHIVDKEEDAFSFLIAHFYEEEDDWPYEVAIKLTVPTKKMCMSWTGQAVHFRKVEETMNNPPMKIPIPFVLEHFDEPGTRIYWDFTLKNNDSD